MLARVYFWIRQKREHLKIFKMSAVFGKITVETPKYTSLRKVEQFEIRRYPRLLRAEVTYPAAEGSSAGFRRLAGFIFGGNKKSEDSNAEAEKIAMTAPVITERVTDASEKIAMTAPVVTEESKDGMMKMSFILPSKYQSLDQLPAPNDSGVKLRETNPKEYAVCTFSGAWFDVDQYTKSITDWLKEYPNDVQVLTRPDGKVEPVLARFNPPWTLPFLRTNEVMIPVKWIGAEPANA